MRTLEQRRAAFALDKVESVKTGKPAKYRTQLVKLPARLHTNGLGQTVAFHLANGGEGSPEWQVATWLGEWLTGDAGPYPRETRLIDCVTATEASGVPESEAEERYRRASAEARALAVWLKRFAEAFLASREEADHDTAGAAEGEEGS